MGPHGAVSPVPEPFYSRRRIAHWLHCWGDLCALAANPGTAHGLTDKRPTQNTPRVGKFPKGNHGDRHRWAVVRADIVQAWGKLGGLEHTTVATLMAGSTLEDLMDRHGDRAVNGAFSRALEQMSLTLEGPPAQEVVETCRRCRTCGAEMVDRRSDAQHCSDRCRQEAYRTNLQLRVTDATS